MKIIRYIFIIILLAFICFSGNYSNAGGGSGAGEAVKTYYSKKLGVKFDYPANISSVKEVGNKIYVYYSDSAYSEGQYVEIFSKNKKDTVEKAIEKRFLKNYPKEKCFVKNGSKNAAYPSSYVKVPGISYPKTETDGPFWENSKYCPPNYSETNGIIYFLGDKSHPNQFAFFSIGQYRIVLSDGDKDWQDTFRFVE